MVHPSSIRRFRAADMEDILRVENACFGRFAYDRNLFAEYAGRQGDLFLVAGKGQRICGYSIACVRVVSTQD